MTQELRTKLIAAGVRDLKNSYPDVSVDNIMTDYIYRQFFSKSLEETIEHFMPNAPVTEECKKLVAEIAACKQGIGPAKPKASRPKKKAAKK